MKSDADYLDHCSGEHTVSELRGRSPLPPCYATARESPGLGLTTLDYETVH